MSKQLTAREFVANVTVGNAKCPACDSENLTWGEINVEGQSTYQEARCQDCDLGFNTVSRLVGFMLDGEDGPQTIAEDFGEIVGEQEPTAPLTCDYRLLDRQIKRLGKFILPAAERTTPAQIQINQDLEGLFEMLCQIAERRPFPEVRDR